MKLNIRMLGRFPARCELGPIVDPIMDKLRAIKRYDSVGRMFEYSHLNQTLDLCDSASLCLYQQLKEELNGKVKKRGFI
jgi:hypothetical protein